MPTLWKPRLPLSTPEGRILSREDVLAQHPCERGWNIFLKVNGGGDALVNQDWALRMAAAGASSNDAWWAALRLLPYDCVGICGDIENVYWGWSFYARPPTSRIMWAVFAALYVEAGKP